jgi:drug/metabolite transporter (DMT)-like permease
MSNPELQGSQESKKIKLSTKNLSNLQKGLILILLSSVVMSLQNILTKIILSKKTILGIWEIGGVISPSLPNSILILVLRMALVFPLMAFLVAPRLYKNSWNDIKDTLKPENNKKLFYSIASGFFLFSSFFSIYLALGTIPAGIATTIFFIYPTITIFIMWFFFKEKPSIILIFAMLTIYIGGFLTIPPQNFTPRGDGNFSIGAISAAFSGIMFASYVIMIKQAKMHPAPFSIISFFIVLLLGVLILPFLDFKVEDGNWSSVLIGAFLLSITTLVGYVLNNFGVPLIGPALSAVIGASGPALTTIFAFALIQETLLIYQILGVFLVTLWVLGISVENLKKQAPK